MILLHNLRYRLYYLFSSVVVLTWTLEEEPISFLSQELGIGWTIVDSRGHSLCSSDLWTIRARRRARAAARPFDRCVRAFALFVCVCPLRKQLFKHICCLTEEFVKLSTHEEEVCGAFAWPISDDMWDGLRQHWPLTGSQCGYSHCQRFVDLGKVESLLSSCAV